MQIVAEAERKEAEAMTYTHRCAVCRSGITLAWGGAFGINSHILRCSEDVNHEGFEKPYRPRLAELGLPWIKASKKEVQRLAQEHGEEVGTKLAAYQTTTALTKEQASFLVKTIWPKAPEAMRKQAIALCVVEQLNPLLKHVHILGPYKNKKTGGEDWALCLGKQAKRMLAGRRCDYSYVEERVLTQQEVIDITGEDSFNEKLWARVIVRDDKGGLFTGIGFVWRNEDILGELKGNSMFNMALGRAEGIALDKCTAGRSRIPLPALPVIDESFLPDIGQIEQVVVADRDTGEIIDGKAKEVQPATPQAPEGPTYLGGQYGDMITECWEHGEPWAPDKFKHLCHKQPDNSYCHFRKLIEPVMEHVAQALGMTAEDIKQRAKDSNQGRSWTELSERTQLEILTSLSAQIHVDAPILKENQDEEQEDEGEGQGALL